MSDTTKVLIVDDKAENLYGLTQILASLDLEIVQATSGNEALAKLLETDFACLLLDVKMPDMDGFETATLIRSNEDLEHVPIIFVTAYSGASHEIFKGYEIGAVDYLMKPLDAHIVRSKVAVFVNLFRQRRTIEDQALRLEAANRDLLRANEELDQFTAIAAHDLKSPLATLVQMAEYLGSVLQDRLSADEAYFMGKLGEVSRTMTDLVEDLLRLSRLGRQQLEIENVDCAAVISTVLEHMAHDLEQAEARVMVNHLPTVCADAGLMYHVFQNLISNAIKYRKPNTQPMITIGAEMRHKQWCLWVVDNGMGIEESDQSSIFQPFKRAYHGDVAGSGIGLAICQKIVERHGGKIWIESKRGVGSTFYLTLSPASCVNVKEICVCSPVQIPSNCSL